MDVAVVVYERLRARHEKAGLVSDDDYVFFPEFKNREYALATLRRQFEHVLKEARLKLDKQARARTLYSLRHTALMFRLLKGDKIDIFKLAHNALTASISSRDLPFARSEQIDDRGAAVIRAKASLKARPPGSPCSISI